MDKDKGHLLGSKWIHERVDKASDKTINKKFAEYIQREVCKLICILLAFLDGLKSRILKN